MNLDFTDRVVIVTGASGNLGRATADAFIAAGACVALVDRKGGGSAVAGPRAERRAGFAADLTDAASARAAADAIYDRWGRIDVLCNVAGGFAMGPPVHETPDDQWRRMFDLNLMTAVHMSAGVVPRMIAAGRGAIVNVGAASSARGLPGLAAYAVAKNAVARLTESMAAELRAHDISVTCILPSLIDTPQNRAAMPNADAATWVRPEAIAKVIVCLASELALTCSGDAIVIAE